MRSVHEYSLKQIICKFFPMRISGGRIFFFMLCGDLAFTFSIQQLPLIVSNYASFDFGWMNVPWQTSFGQKMVWWKLNANKNLAKNDDDGNAIPIQPSINKYLRSEKCQSEKRPKKKKNQQIAWVIISPFYKLPFAFHGAYSKHLFGRFRSMAMNFSLANFNWITRFVCPIWGWINVINVFA